MKKPSAKEQQQRHDEIIAACREVRRQCNKLSDDERRNLHEEALAIIFGKSANI